MKTKTKSSNINIVIENNLFSKNKESKKEYEEPEPEEPLPEREPSLQYIAPFTPEPSFMSEIRQAFSDKNMYGMRYNTQPPQMYNPQGQPTYLSRPAPVVPRFQPDPVAPTPVPASVAPAPVAPKPVPVPVAPRKPSTTESLLGEDNRDEHKAGTLIKSVLKGHKNRRKVGDMIFEEFSNSDMLQAIQEAQKKGHGNLVITPAKTPNQKPKIISTAPPPRSFPEDHISAQLVFEEPPATKPKRGRPKGSRNLTPEERRLQEYANKTSKSILTRSGKIKK
jgi:hypothetical protein